MGLYLSDALTLGLTPAWRGGGEPEPPGEDQWPDGVIDFSLTLDFNKLWNFT